MESALESPAPRLIEYPADLSECSSMQYGGRRLLYLCSGEGDGSPFIVVLGFSSSQKHDIVPKELIEPVPAQGRMAVNEAVLGDVAPEYSKAHVFFL